jgi:hypothetical protein
VVGRRNQELHKKRSKNLERCMAGSQRRWIRSGQENGKGKKTRRSASVWLRRSLSFGCWPVTGELRFRKFQQNLLNPLNPLNPQRAATCAFTRASSLFRYVEPSSDFKKAACSRQLCFGVAPAMARSTSDMIT